ncbi:MAG: hypothetical protein HC809_00770 [Gammaproteobacteria bacterium]|nr:hypothetical protein [Gammaproteobacteria bacterium]
MGKVGAQKRSALILEVDTQQACDAPHEFGVAETRVGEVAKFERGAELNRDIATIEENHHEAAKSRCQRPVL